MEQTCYLCGSHHLAYRKPYRSAPSDKLFQDLKLVRCQKCGLLQVNRYFSEPEIEEYYRNGYDRDKVYSNTDESRFPQDNMWSVSRGRALAKVYRQVMQTDPRIVVDIGCGYGHLLYGFHQHFPQAEYIGVDYEKAAGRNLSKFGAKFVDGGLSDTGHLQGQASVVITSHVFEHVVRPNDFVEKCKALLSPGGCLLWEVPNCTENNSLCDPRHSPHVCFWEESSLRRILADHGMETLFFKSAGKKFHWYNRLPTNTLLKRLARRLASMIDSTDEERIPDLNNKDDVGYKLDVYGPNRRNLRFLARMSASRK